MKILRQLFKPTPKPVSHPSPLAVAFTAEQMEEFQTQVYWLGRRIDALRDDMNQHAKTTITSLGCVHHSLRVIAERVKPVEQTPAKRKAVRK